MFQPSCFPVTWINLVHFFIAYSQNKSNPLTIFNKSVKLNTRDLDTFSIKHYKSIHLTFSLYRIHSWIWISNSLFCFDDDVRFDPSHNRWIHCTDVISSIWSDVMPSCSQWQNWVLREWSWHMNEYNPSPSIFHVIILYEGYMRICLHPCTCSRVNTNYERIASWGGCK